MTTDHTGDGALSPELEAIAARRARPARRRKLGRTYPLASRPRRRVAEAASAAIAAGAASSAIADAERDGELRARQELERRRAPGR